jgi:4-amino-4-deoxy-L-arabinose transferase-like glycosyltransferase
MRRASPSIFVACLLLLAVTLPRLWEGDFRRDSGRYAAVGMYMWQEGNLLAPQIGPGIPYFNKPPLALIIHGFFLKLLGPNVLAARLPSLVAATGVLLFSFLAARQIGSRAEAITSAIVLALTIEFTRRTRAISLDFWQLLFLMAAVWLFLRALKAQSASRMLLAGVGLGLALLCKPFVALGLVPLFGFWLGMTRRGRLWPGLAGAVVVAVLVALPWHLYMFAKFGDAFVRQYFFKEVIGRAQGLNGSEPIYYYLVQLSTHYWPWLPFSIYAVWRRFFGPEPVRPIQRDLVSFGLSWVIWVGVLISLFKDKSPNYALPLYPVLSWITAAGLCRWRWQRLGAWYRAGLKGLAPAAAGLLLLLSLAPIPFDKGPIPEWQALFEWMRAHGTAPNQLSQTGLKINDCCYFYVKTGWWLPDARTNSASAWVLVPGSNEVANAVFKAGSFQLIANPTSK